MLINNMVFTDEYSELYNDYVEYGQDIFAELDSGSTTVAPMWERFIDYETDSFIEQSIDAELDMLFGKNRTEPRWYYIELMQLSDDVTEDVIEEDDTEDIYV
jgi:hypothetical protein